MKSFLLQVLSCAICLAPLVVVLGHSKCGAVSAAVVGVEAPGHSKSIVASLKPAVNLARQNEGDPIASAIRLNAMLAAAALARTEPIGGEWAKQGRVKVVAALYNLETGVVEFLR